MEPVCFTFWSELFAEVMKKEEDWGKERRKKKGRKKLKQQEEGERKKTEESSSVTQRLVFSDCGCHSASSEPGRSQAGGAGPHTQQCAYHFASG